MAKMIGSADVPEMCYGITTAAGGRPPCWHKPEWAITAGKRRLACSSHLHQNVSGLLAESGRDTATVQAI